MFKIRENDPIRKRFGDIIKPSLDKREYRGILLDNELKCILISDPTTDRSVASMDVNVGAMHSKDLPGLAHFCEQLVNFKPNNIQ